MWRKMSIGALLLLVTLNVTLVVSRNVAPVLLWGVKDSQDSKDVDPFPTMSSADFENYLNKTIDGTSTVIVFYKKDLCVEDLVQYRKALQPLTQFGLRYISKVDSPYDILIKFLSRNTTSIDSGDYNSNNLVQISEDENLKDIYDTFPLNNNTIPNVVGILTGKDCRFVAKHRMKRQVADTNSTDIIFNENNVLMYMKNGFTYTTDGENYTRFSGNHMTPTLSGNGTVATPLNIGMTSMDENDQKIFVQMVVVSESNGYWTLRSVLLNDMVLNVTRTPVVFPTTFSYHCAEKIVYQNAMGNAKYKVQFDDLQMEIFTAKNNSGKFSDGYDCVGFVTIPILMGLIVSFLFALIIACGLTMVLDIKTMDRFDDPKGKTITIFANE